MKRQLKEGDWIALRLLALLLKTDVSNQTIPEVRKTMYYYLYRIGIPLETVLWELIKETADEVENPESAMLSRFEATFQERDKEYDCDPWFDTIEIKLEDKNRE